ncbi:hypothetical protein FACS189499_01530 [Clostridia bacterium]|nr:hypothetical protein FACS189499_01530 [Clostridia bacterium]
MRRRYIRLRRRTCRAEKARRCRIILILLAAAFILMCLVSFRFILCVVSLGLISLGVLMLKSV